MIADAESKDILFVYLNVYYRPLVKMMTTKRKGKIEKFIVNKQHKNKLKHIFASNKEV